MIVVPFHGPVHAPLRPSPGRLQPARYCPADRCSVLRLHRRALLQAGQPDISLDVGEDARDAQWNRSDRQGGALGLAGYRMDIDARVVPGIDKNLSGLAFDTDHDRLIAVVNRPATLYTLDRNGEPTAATRCGTVPISKASPTSATTRSYMEEEFLSPSLFFLLRHLLSLSYKKRSPESL